MPSRSDVRLGNDDVGPIKSDAVLPEQFFRRRGSRQPERGLMLAVIENAVDTYRAHFGARDRRGQRLFEEAEAWLMSTETTWPFAFESICDVLNLDPDCLRSGLARWCRQQEALRAQIARPEIIGPNAYWQKRAVAE